MGDLLVAVLTEQLARVATILTTTVRVLRATRTGLLSAVPGWKMGKDRGLVIKGTGSVWYEWHTHDWE